MRGSSPSEEEETGGPQSPENHTRQHGVKREGTFGEQDITETWPVPQRDSKERENCSRTSSSGGPEGPVLGTPGATGLLKRHKPVESSPF